MVCRSGKGRKGVGGGGDVGGGEGGGLESNWMDTGKVSCSVCSCFPVEAVRGAGSPPARGEETHTGSDNHYIMAVLSLTYHLYLSLSLTLSLSLSPSLSHTHIQTCHRLSLTHIYKHVTAACSVRLALTSHATSHVYYCVNNTQ